jgi:hypothetical protein
MNKYELLSKLKEKSPLQDSFKYYILKNKYIYPGVVV